MNLAIKVIKNTAKQFVSSLQKESKKASRKAIGRCGILLRNQARRSLKSSSIKITDSHFGDKLVHGIRTGRIYRQENSFKRNVRITTNRRNKQSGWFRLGWLNSGTNERFQKKRKNKNVGKITARNFYTNAVSSFNFKSKYDEIMNKELSKLKK